MKYEWRYVYAASISLVILLVGLFCFIVPIIEHYNELTRAYQLLSEKFKQTKKSFLQTPKSKVWYALQPAATIPILFSYAKQSGVMIEHVALNLHQRSNKIADDYDADQQDSFHKNSTHHEAHRASVLLDAKGKYRELYAFIALLARDAARFSVGDFIYQPLLQGASCNQLSIHMEIFADQEEGVIEKIPKELTGSTITNSNPFCLQCFPAILTIENNNHTSLSHSAVTPMVFESQQMPLGEAITMMAQRLNLNIMLSPHITGEVTLSLHDAIPQSAFELLLSSHGLGKWQSGNVWFIAPQDELIKQGQSAIAWQEVYVKTLPLFSKTWQLQYAKADEVARLMQEAPVSILSKRGALRVDPRTNTINVQDVAESINTIEQLIKRIDVPVQQILIEARLVSIDHDYERELGIQFHSENQTSSGSQNNNSEHQAKNSDHTYRLALVKLASGSLLDVKLSALEGEGHAALISTPSLFTSNQQPASIEAGEEVPYQEVSEGGGTAVAFKKAVLGLKVTPQVLPQNGVMLKLQINQDRPSNRMVLGVPAITTRQIVTNVLVKAGQTVVLGGIYETDDEAVDSGVPWVKNVPLIGSLLKQNRIKKNKRELLIFVTPKIMR